jgi:hypothetical protein
MLSWGYGGRGGCGGEVVIQITKLAGNTLQLLGYLPQQILCCTPTYSS